MPALPSLDRCRRLYDQVNVAGRFSDTYCREQTWIDEALRETLERGVHEARRPALQNVGVHRHVARAAEDFYYGSKGALKLNMGQSLGFNRALATLQGLRALQGNLEPVQILRQVRQLEPMPILYLASVAELLVGRGHSYDAPPNRNRFFESNGLYHVLSKHGLMGAVLEAAPLKVANALNARGHASAATACVMAACLGRLLLQPLRFAVSLQMLATSAALAGLFYVPQGFVYVIAALALAVLRLAAPVIGPAPSLNRLFERIKLCAHPLAFAQHLAGLEAQPRALAPHEPGVNQRVAAYVNQEIIAVFNRTPPVEDAGAGALADQVAAALQLYCQEAPNEGALRGGLSSLQAFMDATHEDAMWRPTPDYLAERFMTHQLAALRAPGGMDVTAASALADAALAGIDAEFPDVAGTRPREAGRAELQALMAEHHPAAHWHVPVAAPTV